ncbi:diguanylate phosphodiesterase [uncultured Pluralibacter sp.]|uniref:diguanylate phosphodiesterase n=1 Tax=uncultured Pluralibacter sp. TaxID=1490864 RepID=UPI0026340C9B|nr:diguanylate phosphodiesterase [uncultured Pluralibacter sp.]
MLTTILYRSHICEGITVQAVEEMVASANGKNSHANVTGILLYNGTHFFQLLEGPEENVKEIYHHICKDSRHYNIVELLCDYAPARRFGKTGMELFDLREYVHEDVLQRVLDKGTSRYQLKYDDRALQFFRTFVESTEKENYFEIPLADSWEFVADDEVQLLPRQAEVEDDEFSFAFQPIIDPLSREIVALEALLRARDGKSPADYFASLQGDALYEADLRSKRTAFALAAELGLKDHPLSINLLPLTLVKIPDAVPYLLQEIKRFGLIPDQITIEFTESDVMSRIADFNRAVRALKAEGLRVAIEHFGSGFAGLLLLSEFQPDKIKINRSLIQDVHKSGPRQAIIQGIIKCCTSLEISVTAVGVEKAEEWMWLESAGISAFQGNLFASPALQGIPLILWPEKNTNY